jgi:hypothetical protein
MNIDQAGGIEMAKRNSKQATQPEVGMDFIDVAGQDTGFEAIEFTEEDELVVDVVAETKGVLFEVDIALGSGASKSAKIKWLKAHKGLGASEISKLLGIRYQFAYNVLGGKV